MGNGRRILEEARGFTRSRVILSAAELDLFTRIHREPLSAGDLAEREGLHRRALTRLLDVLVTFRLLEKSDGVYRTTATGGLLSSDHPESTLPMLLHLGHMWRNWSGLTETVRRGANPLRAPVVEGADTLRNFIEAMHVVGRDLSREIAASFDASRHRRLLDVGGGSGTYTLAFLEGRPGLQGVLFDLPGVIPLARERISKAGLIDRVRLVEGDFYRDELPGGCDLALLSAIVHQNDPEGNVILFGKILRALEPGGTLLIRDYVMEEERTAPAAGALFALNMLVATEGGDTYTLAELRRDLERAGFRGVRLVRRAERMGSLVEARKPPDGSPSGV